MNARAQDKNNKLQIYKKTKTHKFAKLTLNYNFKEYKKNIKNI